MLIRMKSLKPFGVAGVNEGHVKRGREFSVGSDHRRRELEAHGLAYRLDQPAGAGSPLSSAVENEAADLGPFVSAGGGTGAAGPAPSSPQGRRRRSRRSDGSKDGFLP